jgi:hypothetical protein
LSVNLFHFNCRQAVEQTVQSENTTLLIHYAAISGAAIYVGGKAMGRMLSVKERRYVDNLLNKNEKRDPFLWPSWGPWISFGLGGFLIVFVCFLTISNFSIQNINSILLPGIFSGAVLVIGGYWTQYKSRKAEGDKVLAGILSKLVK